MNSHHSSSDVAAHAAASSGFELLAEPVQRWIWRNGWTELRTIQEEAIAPIIQTNNDLVIAAATAGGKTEAAFLPLVSKLILEPPKEPGFKVVYVSPLKALINDQFRRLDDLCEKVDLPVHRWHGDVAASKKAKARKDPDGILLITPESLEANFVLRGLELAALFKGTQAIVIDELHAFLGPERGMQLASLMDRFELATGRRVRRIGLSATLGDMNLACRYLRRDAANQVQTIIDRSGQSDLMLQLKAYCRKPARAPAEDDDEAGYARGANGAAKIDQNPDSGGVGDAMAKHLFKNLRGKSNLIFAGSRQNVEIVSDRLRKLSDAMRLPNEFYPHHANLSRDHREFLEERLKQGLLPTSAVCTSTLELGIDIGDVESVAQIGPPRSVASLRQRLGRSGRRAGKPAILRLYIDENSIDERSDIGDRLRLRLVQGIAVVELLLEKWFEPPPTGALHLSTLVHQILSVIAQNGGARARSIFKILCIDGAFSSVSQDQFVRALRTLGSSGTGLIEQGGDGVLLLGPIGEQIVEHYSFYAVFNTPEEYRVETAGKLLGTLPVDQTLITGAVIIFSGRRWRVLEVHDREKLIIVRPDPAGRPPKFGGDVENLHDRIAERMRTVLSKTEIPAYLDTQARELLEEGRSWFNRFRLDEITLSPADQGGTYLFPWQGTIATRTLALALQAKNIDATVDDFSPIIVWCKEPRDQVEASLRTLADSAPPSAVSLAKRMAKPREKYHQYLDEDLLAEDVASSEIVADRVPELAASISG